MNPLHSDAVEEIWKYLEKDIENISEKYKFDAKTAHYFLPKDDKFVLRRIETARKALEFISSCEMGSPMPPNSITSRYAEGLPKISQVTLSKLKKQVSKFVA